MTFLTHFFLLGLKERHDSSNHQSQHRPVSKIWPSALFALQPSSSYEISAAAASTAILMNMKPKSQKCFTIDDIKLSDSNSAAQPEPRRFFKRLEERSWELSSAPHRRSLTYHNTCLLFPPSPISLVGLLRCRGRLVGLV